MPLGTGDRIEKILSKHNPSSKFDVVSNPEFLREGEALRDFRYPDRVVIGTNNSKKISPILKKLYDPIIKKGAKFIVVSRKVYRFLKLYKKYGGKLLLVRSELRKIGVKKIDYIKLINLLSFKEVKKISSNTNIFIAYYLNGVRLIDNL